MSKLVCKTERIFNGETTEIECGYDFEGEGYPVECESCVCFYGYRDPRNGKLYASLGNYIKYLGSCLRG